jgi:hypothetical protein
MAAIERRDITLDNWREAPFSRWAFQNVQELVPSAIIAGTGVAEVPAQTLGAYGALTVTDEGGNAGALPDFLKHSQTDSFVVMQKGEIVAEWFDPSCDLLKPHLVFSVSKSITGIMAGILVDRGLLSPDALVTRYVPEAKGSAYGDASVRDVLDMQVALDFNEDYLDRTGVFNRYRRATGWNVDDAGEPSKGLEAFLCTLGKTSGGHGKAYHYYSPNTDMMGIVLERASGRRFADLMREYLWQPMGAQRQAFVTVDKIGTPRCAGGISVTPRDLARFGELVRLGGKGIVSEAWIKDIWTGGNHDIWIARGGAAHFPDGAYRSYWYATGQGELAAIGIHGQWIWIDAAREMVVVKQSCQTEPTHQALDFAITAMMRAICNL